MKTAFLKKVQIELFNHVKIFEIHKNDINDDTFCAKPYSDTI